VTLAAPTILAVETDSAWMVIFAVSLVTLPAALLFRRLINRPGGMLSGILLSLPLLLPLVAALAYQGAVLPEFAVLRPAQEAVTGGAGDLLHLLYLSNGQGGGTFYALIGSVGPWMLLVGLSVSGFMLLRRAVGTYLLHRLIGQCRPPTGSRASRLLETTRRLSECAGLRRVPEVSMLPAGISGAFAVGARRSRILISQDLIDVLEDDELAAILAHEISHITSRDVQVIFTAGLLRDMIAWNPLAHIAFRRLTHDRELEADRRAAALTANPLSVASGLLKMYEVMKQRRFGASRTALAFLRPGGRIARRVTHLLDVADGRVTLVSGGRLPYMMAAVLVAALGLQAGARIAADRAAIAIVWGAPGTSADLYPPKIAARPAPAKTSTKKGQRLEADRPQTDFALRNFSTIREQNVDEWVEDMTQWAEKQGGQSLSPLTLRWEARQDWTAVPLQCTVASICVYRMERGTLLP
jgi:Zn-dependent protease with chaperone function